MRQISLRNSWWLFCGLLLLSSPLSAETESLQIGVLPTLSPRALLKAYEYLRVHVSHEMRQPVALGTGQNFAAFHQQAVDGAFDVVVTAGHFARLLQREAGWIPLATYQRPNQAILVVAKNSPITKPDEFRGKSISSADPLALIAIQTQHWLQDWGLVAGRDYKFVQTPSFTSAAYAVTQGQIALAALSSSSYRQLPDNLKQGVRVFQTLPPIQSIVWMAHPRRARDVGRLKQALLDFTSDTPEGKTFFNVTGYQGMREVTAEEMRGMDPYADLAKSLLDANR